MSRDMQISLRWDDLEVSVNAEGVSYAPDVMDDMGRHMLMWLHDMIVMAHALGTPPAGEDDEEEVEVSVDEE